ncbi:MAG: DNA-processing protein DprA [Clostridiales Family XIII bacterium]|jgi:DNA processing protein|nr:DNA-processing protein DprA [Clostridiales Family XIII bacterium]
MATENIVIIERDDERFPESLRAITDAPKRLHCIGDVSLLRAKSVAVVGARRATDYGRWAARTIGRRLAESGVCVVSGMAEGADTAAHIGALEGGGKTVAVLGCGIDICFPTGNKKLKREIEEKGLVVSEYPPGAPGGKFTFPRRNRIISGLSAAVVVAEAGVASGSLITAEFAVDQGREVYAVPGNINRLLSAGANKLIRDGARPLVLIDDLLADLGAGAKYAQNDPTDLAEEERAVFNLAKRCGEVTIDEAASLLMRSVASLTATVTLLEMKGVLSYEKGRFFVP